MKRCIHYGTGRHKRLPTTYALAYMSLLVTVITVIQRANPPQPGILSCSPHYYHSHTYVPGYKANHSAEGKILAQSFHVGPKDHRAQVSESWY